MALKEPEKQRPANDIIIAVLMKFKEIFVTR